MGMRRGAAAGAILSALLAMGAGACINRPEDGARGGDGWAERRATMVAQLRAYGMTNEPVLRAMARVRRHAFIPDGFRRTDTAYADSPCPIGYGQTISQPYIVAYMTDRLGIGPGAKVLEVGTGSGYQAAVLAECGAEVYSIEIVSELARHARAALEAEGYAGVRVRTGDGYLGWPEHAPFDRIVLTCAPDSVPRALIDQLAEGGRLIAPVGAGFQRLVLISKRDGRVEQQEDLPVRFVPMVRP